MKGIKDLVGKFDEETLSQKTSLCEKWLNKFYNFVLNHVSSPEVKKRMQHVYESLTIYITEQGKTRVPRYYNGEDYSFKMPYNGGVYFTEICETKMGEDNHRYTYIIPAVAVASNLNQPKTFIHEISHAFSSAMKYLDEEGGTYKCGFHVSQISNDEFKAVSGDFLNEGMTEAVTKLFLVENFDELKQDFPAIKNPESNGAYKSKYAMYEMLDGGNNKLLMDAYFGGVEEYQRFEKHFDELMKDEGITFKELNKLCFSTYTYEGENSDLARLNKYANIYRERYKQFSMQEDIEMDM